MADESRSAGLEAETAEEAAREAKAEALKVRSAAAPIGVGRAGWFRLPLPPNRTCGSPASGPPAGGLAREATDGPRTGVSRKLRGSRLVGSISIRVIQAGGSSRSHQRRDRLRRF